ncbi:MAG: MotA/TolQ/ExbB proton channel family protein [Flavobacteriia bacterium]
MSKNQKTSGGFTSLVASIAIVIALVIGIVVYKYVFGNPGNFVDNDPTGEPLEGNFMGIIYKGGIIVPVLVAMNIIVIIFSVERFITLSKAKGKGGVDKFVEKIRHMLDNKEIDGAIAECNRQKGSLANVVRAGLEKYEHIANDTEMNKEQKVESLKKELEEATSLELPMLSKNLGVLSTSASVATLIGLIGTVLGMIRAFAAMSHGTPDTSALATGISEALINTAFGIFASTMAIILYNFFSTKIDGMTYSMDEASFSIVQDFTAKNK